MVMNVDETTEETTAIAHPEAMHTHGAAGAAPSIASPPKAGSLRPRDDQRSPGDAPPRAYSRTSDDDVLNYMSDGVAGAAGASGTPCALTQMMDAAAGAAIPAISAAAQKKKATAAGKAARAEQRKAVAARKKADPPQHGAASAAPQPTTLQAETETPPGLPEVMEVIPEAQQMPPGQLDPVAFPPLSVPMAAHLAPAMDALNRASQSIRPTAIEPVSTGASTMPSRIMSPRVGQGDQVCKPTPPCSPRPRPSECAHTAHRCALMMMTMTALITYASPVWRGGESRCNRGPGLSRGSPPKRHKSHGGPCLQAVPLNSEDLMEFWNATARGCKNSQEVETMLRAHPEMALRMRATPDNILFDIPVLYSALRMGHPNMGVLEVESTEETFQGGYTDYVSYQDRERENQMREGGTNDVHTGEPLTAEGVMWMGAQAFAAVRSTHESLKLRPTPPSDLHLPEGFGGEGIGKAREDVSSVALPDGTIMPRDHGDILAAMDEQTACIRRLEDHIRVRGLGCHPRAKASVWFLECYNLKLSHRVMELIWKEMQTSDGTSTGVRSAEPIHPPVLTEPCPPEQRVHPALDATASVTAAADTRDGRFRIQKRPVRPVRLQHMMAERTETGGAATKSRAAFTPGSLASMVSMSRAREQKSATGDEGTRGPPSVTPSLPTANPFRALESPDDWEMDADTADSPVNPPAPAAQGANLTTPPALNADAKGYAHVDIAYALITNRLNTQSVPADAMAMQFGETISEREEIPGMEDVLTAVCLAYDRETGKPNETGP